jgi:hypothetical protein
MTTMRILILVLTIFTFLACHKQREVTSDSTHIDNSIRTLEKCFINIDTVTVGQTIGCVGGIYKLIDDRYVVRLDLDVPIQFDSCYTISIDTLDGKWAELWVFDNKNASLTNICTDILITNSSGPARKLHAKSGQLVIGFSDRTEYYGNATQYTTVLIKSLLFTDFKTGKSIELKNELLWKVLDLGTPG